MASRSTFAPQLPPHLVNPSAYPCPSKTQSALEKLETQCLKSLPSDLDLWLNKVLTAARHHLERDVGRPLNAPNFFNEDYVQCEIFVHKREVSI